MYHTFPWLNAADMKMLHIIGSPGATSAASLEVKQQAIIQKETEGEWKWWDDRQRNEKRLTRGKQPDGEEGVMKATERDYSPAKDLEEGINTAGTPQWQG